MPDKKLLLEEGISGTSTGGRTGPSRRGSYRYPYARSIRICADHNVHLAIPRDHMRGRYYNICSLT